MKTTGVNEMKHAVNNYQTEYVPSDYPDNIDMLSNDNSYEYLAALYKKQQYPRFEIVSFEQFKNDWLNAFNGLWDEDNENDMNDIKYIYNCLAIPHRSTKHSAGYDFKSPINFKLQPGESIMIPTGIRSYMPKNMVLMIFPRSGLGTKYRLGLCNTASVIDSDYFYSDNEGHIYIKMINEGDKVVTVDQGKAFCQGIFTNYFVTLGDDVKQTRNGGFGSSGV